MLGTNRVAEVHEAATSALKAIDPEAAAKAGAE